MYDIVGEELTPEVVSGDEDISGDVGFFGAFPRPLQPRAMARPAQAAIARPAGPAVVRQAAPTALRRQVLPLPPITLGPGSTQTVTLQPQRPFRVERLVLSSDAAPSPSKVTVQDISVGASRQFVSAGDVPIAAFAADAIGTALRGDTANPGTTVTLVLRNNGSMTENIYGAFFGEALD